MSRSLCVLCRSLKESGCTDGHTTSAFITVLFILLPLGVSYDAAAASSECDLLIDALNEKRKRGDATDSDSEHAIRRVELILSNENTNQGLGFCVGYRVVDLKTLGNIMAAIVGIATTAVPILFSLRPSTASDGVGLGGQCELTELQTDAIRGLAGLFNASCTYNITVGPAGVTLGG